jgi:hypothetical protein
MHPPRTYQVQAGFALLRLEANAVVDWAIDALEAGFDSKSLRILAGLERPLDREEVEGLYGKSILELGINPLPSERYVPFHITAVLRSMLGGEIKRIEALKGLSDLCISRGQDRVLQPFYLLYFAKSDLESQGIQWYWTGADASNIDRVIDEYAIGWLKDHSCDEIA